MAKFVALLPALVGTAAVAGPVALGGTALAGATTGLFGAAGAFSLGTTIGTLGTAFSGLNMLSGGLAQSSAESTNASLAAYNAELSRRSADRAKDSAAQQAADTRNATRRRIGTIRSSFGKSGVVTTSGSPLLAVQEQQAEGDIEAQRQLFAGSIQASGFRSDSLIEGVRASSLRKKSKNTKTGAILDAGSKFLGSTLLS